MTSYRYEIIERLPTVTEHNFLWQSVGWGEIDAEMTKRSIAGSVHGVVAVCNCPWAEPAEILNPYKSQQLLNSVHGKDQ
ncbi:hypothetical protein [Paenibacillus durus]|uniref:hypothetical protein n=1 Tax=Paenibacillus durus TaxID=44251 RepID=UPI00130D5867|nr:hypothetical protein [Paenibacillus durus]